MILCDILKEKLRETEKYFQDEKLNAFSYPIDITKVSEVKNLIKWVKEKFISLDILVNNAGITI